MQVGHRAFICIYTIYTHTYGKLWETGKGEKHFKSIKFMSAPLAIVDFYAFHIT